MATFNGTTGIDVANATLNGGSGFLSGFFTGTTSELTDGTGDLFTALGGDDTIVAGSGDDTINGGLGADSLNGGGGFDLAIYIDAAQGLTVSLATPGLNTFGAFGDSYASIEGLTGSAHADVLEGNGTDNLLNGGSGASDDTLRGGLGNDTLNGGLGADSLDGGDGVDIASYVDAAQGLTVSLATPGLNTFGAFGDSYASIEGLTGSAHADVLEGNGSENLLNGGSGASDDTLRGGLGNDTLNGGLGADSLDGGDGVDVASYVDAAQGLTASLATPGNNTFGATGDIYVSIEGLIGSSLSDLLVGNTGDNLLDGGSGTGDDTLRGGAGNDTLNGGANGTAGDTADLQDAVSALVLTLDASGGAVVTATGSGTDTLIGIESVIGGSAPDIITGNAGVNVLTGGGARDRLAGAGGDDTIIGGRGIDFSVYTDFSGDVTWRYNANGSWTITTPTNGTDTVSQAEYIALSDRSIKLYRLEGEEMAGDFNGDGREDVLLRNGAGAFETWEMAANGTVGTVRTHANLSYDQLAVGVGNFDGSLNATDDIVFRNEVTGTLSFWSMNGTATPTGAIALPLEWHVHAVADFNGDNTDDLLLRNANNDALLVWQMDNFGVSFGAPVAVVSGAWRLLGVGDFDGDNAEDMLWYNGDNTALSIWQMNGAVQVGGGVLGVLDETWAVQGIADYNGDGRDDILWRHTSGALAQWQMDGNTVTNSNVFSSAPANGVIQNVATYDSGATADILWRDTVTGGTTLWSMNGMTIAGTQSLTTLNVDWWII